MLSGEIEKSISLCERKIEEIRGNAREEMIFTGNKTEKLRIVTVRGNFASAMSFSSLQNFIRDMQEEAIRNNQTIIFDNHEMRTTEMDERFSRIIGE